ncbi:MAG: hypothetical protein ABIR55_05330, partial [Burkholderiaceae bacterium]
AGFSERDEIFQPFGFHVGLWERLSKETWHPEQCAACHKTTEVACLHQDSHAVAMRGEGANDASGLPAPMSQRGPPAPRRSATFWPWSTRRRLLKMRSN